MKKTTRKQLRTIRRRRLALALVGAMAMPGAAMAQSGCFDCLPMYGEVVSGSATSNMTTGGVIRPDTDLNSNTMTITQTTKGAIIDWGSFNIGEGYGVTFDQQFGSSSVTLNRVVGFGYGGNPSFIDGRLSSNGSVFIINSAGITFSSGAQVNVGGIVASTLDISNVDFNAGVANGRFQFTPVPFVDTDDNGTPDAYVAGEIYNSGTITTAQGGTVAFVGSSLGNNGDITAQGGSVVFGSAQQVTLDFFGDGLTQVTINSTGVLAPPNLGCELNCTNSPSVLANYGTIAANAGQIVMRVAAPVGGGSEIINGGTLRAQGVANRAGRVELIAQGGTVSNFATPDGFFAGSIDVSGGSFAGGSVVLQGDEVAMQSTSDQFSSIDASGGTSGGSILLEANNHLTAFGRLYAGGGTSGGNISTFSGGTFDIRGLYVDAGSFGGSAGTWTVWAPNLSVVAGDFLGSIEDGIEAGQSVQDADISNALNTGTNVTLRAGTTPSDGGYIHFNDGVDIFYDDGTVPLAFRADAQAVITGDNFSITSNGASLLMAFNADANNLSYGFAGISFTGATLESNGADILFYGQSDAANGVASSYSTGIELSGTSVTTNGGNVVLRGASTGSDAGSDAAGVVVNNTSIDAGAGAVTIYGTGERETGGVFMEFVTIASGASGVLIEGRADEGDGVRILGGDIESDGGPLSILGYGGEGGVYAYNTDLYSNGGDIAVHGEGDAADGTYFNGSIASEGGAIDIYGSSNSANGLVFHSGLSYGIDSGGGAILLTGDGVTGGTTLVGNGYGTGSIDGGGGPITIIGTASGVDATAVLLSEIDVIGASGDISVRGISQLGNGVLFEYGASISTATGAIGLYGTGADFGLDIADGAIDTDSGDITLEGTATSATATAGVRVTGDGLTTDGGDIRVTGTSAGGVGVQLGDGSTFAIGSGGGAISIEGTGIDVGVLMQLNDVASGGGAVSVTGTGAFFGVSLEASDIDSAGGSIDIEGTASASGGSGVSLVGTQLIGGAGDVTVRGTAADGIGLLLARGTNISTTTGSIGLYGTGADFGLDITDGALDTDSGDITLEGTATAATAIAGVRVTGDGLTTDGGDIRVTGTSAGGVGVQLGDGGAFAIGSGGGAISIEGTGIDAGVLMQGNQVASAGGAVSIIGTGATTGVSLDGSDIDSAGGSIDIEGTASASGGSGVSLSEATLIGGAGDVTVRGTAAAGVGVLLANGASISTTTGSIGLYGTGADFGLDIADGAIDTDSGDITLEGTATAATAIAGVRVTGDGLTTDGGDITVTGTSAGGVGVQLGDSDAFAIGSGGGAISIEGTGIDAGVLMQGNQVASDGGAVSIIGTGATTGVSLDGSDIDSAGGSIDIEGTASGSGVGIDLADARLIAGAGDIRLFGDAALGSGVNFTGQSGVATTTGDISITGIGASIGLDLGGGELTTDSGHIDLRGRGTSSGSIGLRIGQGVSIATDGGGIELSGQGDGGAGLVIGDGASVDAGDSLIVLRATSTTAADSIDIAGSIRSSVGVNLRPGGVDLQGQLTEATGDSIYLGSGTGGFVLSDAELALIDTPELVIGSNLHAGSIQVLGGINREGNLTLQNDGGSGGIDIQAGLDVGDATLALSSGGSITQTSAGVITAHSLLAQAGGDVLLAAALNDVASTTLAGSAGGDFEFQDANDLAIGSVSAIGFDTSSGQLSSFSATGIEAGGDVFVRNLQGDLTLDAGVTATNIDLVTAGRLQNAAGASLVASGNWRVWASTWDGEARGGLAGDGDLPNLYGCAYLGTCGVTVSSGDNHFIYVQQPIAVVTFDNATREYGLQNPLFTFSVTGAILGDTAANVATGSASTTATIGSDVGLYPILGSFASAAGYQIQFVPGNLAITPATLLFTADGAVRYLGFPNPDFTGTVTGFRNDDTVASVFGDTVIWSSPAGPLSPIGNYPIIGGTSARNYVFTQAPGNAAALQVILLPSVPGRPVNFIRETVNTYVYDRNFGGAPMCAVNASIDDTGLASSGDELSQEWMKVRSRPNLTNCFDSERENGCGSF